MIHTHIYRISKITVLTLHACLGFIFVIMGITISIHRFRSNKSDNRYMPGVISNGVTVLFLSPR